MKKSLVFQLDNRTDARQEGTFMVPSACHSLYLQYDLKPPYTFLVFLLLTDPEGHLRLQKQLSYSKPVIRIGENTENTTIGAIPGAIGAGRWKLEIYLFAEHVERMLKDGAISFTVTVMDDAEPSEKPDGKSEYIRGSLWADDRFYYRYQDKNRLYQTGERWYKGDLHAHTRLSDGKEHPHDVNRKAKKMGLDYYVATEHNLLHTGWPDTDVLIMPGVEVTTTLGHANLFGLDKRPEAMTDILCHKDAERLAKDMRAILAECKERAWLFSMNHPFLYIWSFVYEELALADLNCLEIINDPTYETDPDADARTANEKAMALSDMLWADGYRICAIGGSDSHNREDEFYPGATEPSIPGDPATWLYMDGLSEQHVLDALINCRSYVTRHCQVEVRLSAIDAKLERIKDVQFGDRLPDACRALDYRILISGPKELPSVYYIKDGEKHACTVTKSGLDLWYAKGTIPVVHGNYQWIRFGARRADGDFLLYANPVTKGTRTHVYHTFGEIRDELEKRWKR